MSKRDIYKFISGVRWKGHIIRLSLPLAVYVLYRFWYRFIHNRIGLRMNRLVVTVVCLLFAAALVLIVLNIIDRFKLKKALKDIPESTLIGDFKAGQRFLNGSVVVGERYIFSNGSSRLFEIETLSGVYDDIREIYNVVTMVMSGADDIVKKKVVKAEYYGKGFLYDRRICAVSVHDTYDSDIGTTKGYEQMEALEALIKEKINTKDKF